MSIPFAREKRYLDESYLKALVGYNLEKCVQELLG
jgi:hypothetical protein